MGNPVLGFDEIARSRVGVVGGKGASLGELSRIDGIEVPTGFFVTTDAFRQILVAVPSIDDLLDELAALNPADRQAIVAVSAEVRRMIEHVVMPDELASAITDALERLGGQTPYAVRSSATAEDLPTASFAGQHDSYLNVVGPSAVLHHVRRCWASLFTERAVTYRLHNGFDHRKVHMAVVVQQMVLADVAGILFTADPITGNRKVAAIDASFGLGEALVSGRVNADSYRVRDGQVVARTIGAKQLAIHALPNGGTQEHAVDPTRQGRPALSDEQVVQLARLGRRIEAHFGRPQDIEWCLTDGGFHIVQARPITTLFPVPETDDDVNHVYVSVGHQQMMTDAMKPLGLSVWQLTAMAAMHTAGGRLFVDITKALATPAGRAGLIGVLGRSDPLVRDALETIVERGDIVPAHAEDAPAGSMPPDTGPASIETDPAIVTGLIERAEASIAAVQRDIWPTSGLARIDAVLEAIEEHKRSLSDPLSTQVIMAGMQASWWLNDHLQEWLGEKNAADILTRSAPGNVTSEMGLALLDVADVIRPHPELVALLQNVEGDDFLAELAHVEGGREAHDAIEAYLDRYGMRCVGEIDITRPRWCERPSALVPLILDNVRIFEPGAGRRRFDQGRQQAEDKEREVLERLRALPDGEQKADETKRMIDRVRTFVGYREYPKYAIVRRYFIYKQALLAEADCLVQAGVLRERDDIFFLTVPEVRDVVRSHQVDHELSRRKEAFESYCTLTPPRVLTSEGEVFNGAFRRDDAPPGSLVGLAVSTGTVEGRARVIHDMEQADIEPGDILVTTCTDPSWTPLFVAVAGLVTEVGGLMTHGAVIAREYGLPAVVGVARATQLIHDGQQIRVHGTDGYVELLD